MTAINILKSNHHQTPPLSLAEFSHHHLLIVGQTGSGKTTTTLALLDELQQTTTTVIILDPTGEYRQLPQSQHYTFGDNCYLDAGRWNGEQLLEVLNISHDAFQTELVNRAIQSLRLEFNLYRHRGTYRKINRSVTQWTVDVKRLGPWAKTYPLLLLPDQLIEEMVEPFGDRRADYQLLGQQYDRQLINRQWQFVTAVRQRLAEKSFQQLFDTAAHPQMISYELRFVLQMYLTKHAWQPLVLDLSKLHEEGKAQRLLISLIFQQMLQLRLGQHRTQFPVEVVIDEAHRYLPVDSRQLADNGIFRLLREGRKAGLSLLMTTQSTLDLPDRLRSQFATLIVHHLASREELAYLHQQDLPTTSLKTGEVYLLHGDVCPSKWQVQAPSWLLHQS